MQRRTFLRIMIESLLVNNALARALREFLNFCNEQTSFCGKKLKFSEKMPYRHVEQTYEKTPKFVFNGKDAMRAVTK